MEGHTASGAPFFKAEGEDFFIYWDKHCDGVMSSIPRWIIDTHRPNANRTVDLDDDADCHYLARTITGDSSMPPMRATWRVYCEGGWEDVLLTLPEAFARAAENNTCEDVGKVTITSVRACSLAASYFKLPQTTPLTVHSPEGPPGCVWDPLSSELQLVEISGHGAGGPSRGHSQAHAPAPSSGHSSSPEAKGHGTGHRRLLSEQAPQALCTDGHLATPGNNSGGTATISAAAGLRGRASLPGVLAAAFLWLAAAV
mmetsp:Transcript_93770/g.289220  ORF Transcript_93770/g.289220 Transcript_93770/m.289220 type:complete len:256 (+) Transcript_93770:1-768(+)